MDNEGAVEECILPVTWLLGMGFEGDFEWHQSSGTTPSTDKSWVISGHEEVQHWREEKKKSKKMAAVWKIQHLWRCDSSCQSSAAVTECLSKALITAEVEWHTGEVQTGRFHAQGKTQKQTESVQTKANESKAAVFVLVDSLHRMCSWCSDPVQSLTYTLCYTLLYSHCSSSELKKSC